MNPDFPQNTIREPADEPSGGVAAEGHGWRHWARRLLVCNPFFLGSAALLLFAIHQLSGEDRLFRDEVQNLVFNFASLQFYELLLVATAVILARRRIWYDSALLVVLEQGLLLVPFMLISQATLQGQAAQEGMSLAWTLCIAGVLVGVCRSAVVGRWYPQFNLPPRALLLGTVILLFNVALPLVFRPRMELDVADWADENAILWNVGLPLLAAGANLLRRPERYGGLNPERHWLPLFIYGLWLAGSAVHVWSIAHICDLPLRPAHLAPLACVVVWTLWNRLEDLTPNPSSGVRGTILGAALVAPLPAFADSHLFVTLAGGTHLAFVLVWLRSAHARPLRAMAGHLAVVSMGLLVAGMPEEWSRLWLPVFSRERISLAAGAMVTLIYSMRSRLAGMGLAGSLAAGAILILNPSFPPSNIHAVVQIALVFLLLHSFRWDDDAHPANRLLRGLGATAWIIDAALWTRDSSGILFVSSAASTILLVWLVAWWLQQRRFPWVLPLAAVLVLCAGPGNWLFRRGSDGLLALLASLALFAVGILVAWTRHRWENDHPPKADG